MPRLRQSVCQNAPYGARANNRVVVCPVAIVGRMKDANIRLGEGLPDRTGGCQSGGNLDDASALWITQQPERLAATKSVMLSGSGREGCGLV